MCLMEKRGDLDKNRPWRKNPGVLDRNAWNSGGREVNFFGPSGFHLFRTLPSARRGEKEEVSIRLSL